MIEISRDLQVYADLANELDRAIESGSISSVKTVWDKIIPINYCVVISERRPGYAQLYEVLSNRVRDFKESHREVLAR